MPNTKDLKVDSITLLWINPNAQYKKFNTYKQFEQG